VFWNLLPLALGSAAYPTLLTMVVIIIGRENARRLLTAYVLGGLLVSIAAGFLVVKALDAGHVVGGSDHTVGPGVDIVVGLLALLLFWILLTNRDAPIRERRAAKKAAKANDKDDRDPWSKRILEGGSVKLVFVLALVLNLPGALYLVALKDIAAADQSTGAEIIQILGYNAIMYILAEIPLISFYVAPEATKARVNAFNDWLGSHGRQIAMVLAGAAGVILIINGIVDFG